VERCVAPEELRALRQLQICVEEQGLGEHPACAKAPHTRRAATLLRFLRARGGDVPKAVALLREAMDWRQQFEFDQKMEAWRAEREDGNSRRVQVLRKYDYVTVLGADLEGLPVYLHRFSQGDPSGLAREIGEEALLLRLLEGLEDCFEAAQERMLKTGNVLTSFVEVYDMGNYGFVPRWLPRGMAAMGPFRRFAPVFDKVYPERVRVAFILRTPPAFAFVWRLTLPMIPEATRGKIRLKGFQASSWLAEMEALLPKATIPLFLRVDDLDEIYRAEPWGGIVPVGAAAKDAAE